MIRIGDRVRVEPPWNLQGNIARVTRFYEAPEPLIFPGVLGEAAYTHTFERKCAVLFEGDKCEVIVPVAALRIGA